MKETEKLRIEADRRHLDFLQSASNFSNIMRPVRLLDEVAGLLDPDFAWLKRIQGKVSQHPVPVLAACAGFLLLTRALASSLRSTSPVRRQTRRSARLSTKAPKGDKNGYDHIAEHF
jgi:hypothetical protein